MSKNATCELCNKQFPKDKNNWLSSAYLHLSRSHRNEDWQSAYVRMGGKIKNPNPEIYTSPKGFKKKPKRKASTKRKYTRRVQCELCDEKYTRRGLFNHLSKTHRDENWMPVWMKHASNKKSIERTTQLIENGRKLKHKKFCCYCGTRTDVVEIANFCFRCGEQIDHASA